MAINKSAIHSIYAAAGFAEEFRIAYGQLKAIQAKMELYQAGTDPIFNAAINAAISTPTRTEITSMKPSLDIFLLDWEAHPGVISPS